MTGRTQRYAAWEAYTFLFDSTPYLQNAANKARYCSNRYVEFPKRDATAQDAATLLGERPSLSQPLPLK